MGQGRDWPASRVVVAPADRLVHGRGMCISMCIVVGVPVDVADGAAYTRKAFAMPSAAVAATGAGAGGAAYTRDAAATPSAAVAAVPVVLRVVQPAGVKQSAVSARLCAAALCRRGSGTSSIDDASAASDTL